MGSKCAHLLADSYTIIVLYAQFNFTNARIATKMAYYPLIIQNKLGQIYPVKLEIEDKTEQHFCCLLGVTLADLDGRSTSLFFL